MGKATSVWEFAWLKFDCDLTRLSEEWWLEELSVEDDVFGTWRRRRLGRPFREPLFLEIAVLGSGSIYRSLEEDMGLERARLTLRQVLCHESSRKPT